MAKENLQERKLFAVVRLKGSVGASRPQRDAMEKLLLPRVNSCILMQSDRHVLGMVKKVANFMTWGEIRPDVLERLLEKRGRKDDGARLDAGAAKAVAGKLLAGKVPKEAGIEPVLRLSPPRKGVRSIRLFNPRGSLGYRGDDINDLLGRMI